jgi:uncharacterized protein (TIGR03083 family)
MELAAAERREFADFLETLAPEQWDAPTLCEKWSVRDVVAHVISYDELSPRDVAKRFGRGLLSLTSPSQLGVQEYRTRTPDELIALIREYAVPRGLTSGFGGRIALTDGTIHHQDIRRPLGKPRDIPPERLVPVLDQALRAPNLPAWRHARGLRLDPTNLDWSHGKGPEVTGPGEAILMAIAGRPDALPELEGTGTEVLSARVG